MWPLVSSDSAVNDAIRRNFTSSGETGEPSPVTNGGASSDASIPSARRSSRHALRVGPWQVAQAARRRRSESSRDWRASNALRWNSARSASSSPRVSPGNASENAPAGVDRGVDLVARVVVLEDHVDGAHAGDAPDGGGRIRRHQEREVRRALRRW